MSEVTVSHDARDWREAFETSEPGPELNRIRARVAAARQRGENDALVAVVVDEASGWRERALRAEATIERALGSHLLDPENYISPLRDIITPVRALLRGDS